MFKCILCETQFDTEKSLHLHLGRVEKVKLEDYYTEWEPRFSRKSGELIKFKNLEQYRTSIFNSRIEMVSWLKANKKEASDTIKELIKLRKNAKGLVVAPDTVYSRSCLYPPPTLVEHLGYDYNKICAELGLETPRDYRQKLEFADDSNLNLIIDQREQSPLKFDKRYKIIKNSLSFGDYSTSSAHFKNLFIERKSLSDLCGSLSKGFERLCREFDRATDMEASIVVLVEEDLNAISSVGYTPHTKKIKAKPEFLFSRIRDILVKYRNVQFVFCKGREDAAQTVVKLLTLKNDINTVDYQFHVDLKT